MVYPLYSILAGEGGIDPLFSAYFKVENPRRQSCPRCQSSRTSIPQAAF